jgi:hypothetical protein
MRYREKLQAFELFKNTHLVKLELLSNATTIDSALHYIRNKQQQQEETRNTIAAMTVLHLFKYSNIIKIKCPEQD